MEGRAGQGRAGQGRRNARTHCRAAGGSRRRGLGSGRGAPPPMAAPHSRHHQRLSSPSAGFAHNIPDSMADEELNLYDEIEIEDCFYDETLQIYHHPCPCGDRFEISIADMRDGEDIARCPSCSLMIRIIFDPVPSRALPRPVLCMLTCPQSDLAPEPSDDASQAAAITA